MSGDHAVRTDRLNLQGGEQDNTVCSQTLSACFVHCTHNEQKLVSELHVVVRNNQLNWCFMSFFLHGLMYST